MFTVKTGEEFISDIRALDESLSNLRISSVEVDKKNYSITYNFICDKVVDEELKNKILSEAEKITARVFRAVEVTVTKIVSNDQLVDNEIFNYLNSSYPSISIFLKPTDIRSGIYGNLVKYVIKLTKDGVDYAVKNGLINKLNNFLATKFCSDFAGSLEEKEADESISLLSEEVYESQLQKIEHRTIKVSDVVCIDEFDMGDLALYIEDAISGDVIICGKITDIAERQSKTGKPFFILNIDDTTGRASGLYFTKKNTYQKIKELKVGDDIIARASIGEYNGRKSFTFQKINRCTFPSDFVKKDRYKKTAPKTYALIHPEPAKTVKISSVFDNDAPLPQAFTKETFVVFDLETTGLDVMSNGITEIGAVKIMGGKIVEQFTTLVKPDYPITSDNQAITGISEDMVKNSPKIGAVIPDFMKFIEGAVLVAHNADFDTKFIKRFAGAEDYEIKNKIIDTLEVARKVLPFLKKHDLHTLGEHFDIAFHHHRALSDAYATAEVFIRLIKIKGDL
ncbi:MAG: hypothetical protein E7369_05440 [Clostridiales bacterium]|nr:hypothetical protein [Clostridiales bacterium]